jgi:hypothetical protein
MKDYTDERVVQNVLTLIVATQINWWNTNHHTGQGKMSPFILKSVKTLFLDNFSSATLLRISHQQSARSATGPVHMLRSTYRAYSLVGLFWLCRTQFWGTVVRNVSSDFVLRASGPPAGTAANYLTLSVLEKYYHNNVLAATPHFRQIGLAARGPLAPRGILCSH